MSLPQSVIVIGLTWPGCARRKARAAPSCEPLKGSCKRPALGKPLAPALRKGHERLAGAAVVHDLDPRRDAAKLGRENVHVPGVENARRRVLAVLRRAGTRMPSSPRARGNTTAARLAAELRRERTGHKRHQRGSGELRQPHGAST